MSNRNITNVDRTRQLKLLAAVATRKNWVSIAALHFVAEAYKFPVLTRQTLMMLIQYGMVVGDFTNQKENFKITTYGKETLASPPELQKTFFKKSREFSDKIGVCSHCGTRGPTFPMKGKLLCATCLNPDYEPSYTSQGHSSLGIEA